MLVKNIIKYFVTLWDQFCQGQVEKFCFVFSGTLVIIIII